MMTQFKHSFLLLFAALLFSAACQREHSNIFDPKNDLDSLDLNLKISRSDSVVTLRWWSPGTVSYQGFNIFRKAENENAFRLLAAVPADSFSYNDSNVSYEISYTYFLSVFGNDVESPPTPVIKTTPGAGNFWILDYWNFYILNLTFDVQHILKKHYAIWRPKAMSFSDNEKTALITYPGYGYFEIFDPQTNAYLLGSDQLLKPYDCLFESSENRFWISDSTGGIYTIDIPSYSLNTVTEALSRPTYLCMDDDGKLYILDKLPGKIYQFDPGAGTLAPIEILGDSVIHFTPDPKRKHILAIDNSSGRGSLNSYGTADSSFAILYSDSSLSRVRVSAYDGTIWISLNYQNSAEIVQLSADGQRLNSLNGFDYIADFNISSETGYLVIADMNFNTDVGTIRHIRPDGTVIGTSKEAYFPYRVYIR